MDSKADVFLWKRLKSGDKGALESIYNTHIEALLQYGMRFSNNQQLVEDAIQDLFIYIWNRREGLSDTDSIIRYLLVSLKRNLFKKLKVAGKTVDAEPEHHSFAAELSIEDVLISEERDSERSQLLAQAFQQLSAKQKEAIYLRFYQKMEYDAICEILDINYQSVRNLISRSLQKLRDHMPLAIVLSILYFFTKILSTKPEWPAY